MVITVHMRDGSVRELDPWFTTTHEHMGVCPTNEGLSKVLQNNGYIVIVEKGGHPRSNIKERIFGNEITDIRVDGTTVMYIPPYRYDDY